MRSLRWFAVVPLVVAVVLTQVRSAPAGPPRVVRGPYLQSASETAVSILGRTDQPTGTRLEYGEGACTAVRSSTTPVRSHHVRLSGLRAGTRYLYRIVAGGRTLRDGLAFTTNKPAGTPFRFVVFGDSGSGEPGQYALASRMAAAAPDLILHTGDVVYPRGAESGYDARFFRPYAALLARVTLWPSLGNHDVISAGGRPYLDCFVLPTNGPTGVTAERNYSFDYADAHFVALDSTLGDTTLRDKVVPWMLRDLAASTRRWKFVFFHHAPYVSALHGESARIQRLLVPAIARAGVDVVFNGHDHVYERSKPMNGVTYIVTGAGGAGLYAHKHPHAYTARFHNRAYSFTQVDVAGERLTLRQVNTRGEVVDEWHP